MIDSTFLHRTTFSNEEEQIVLEMGDNDGKVSKSTLYHLIQSHLTWLFNSPSVKQKQFTSFTFGSSIAFNFAEEQTLGNSKYFLIKASDKKQAKPFVGQMKFLNTKLWPTIFQSTSKLFSIVHEASSYKLEDSDFGLTKCLKGGDQNKLKEYKILVHQFCKGVVDGYFSKFGLAADIIFSSSAQDNICFQFKNVHKKDYNKIRQV